MKPLKPILTTTLLLAFSTASGCSLFSRPVYIAPGEGVEAAEVKKIKVWVTNKETGKREYRTLSVQPGYYIDRIESESSASSETADDSQTSSTATTSEPGQ